MPIICINERLEFIFYTRSAIKLFSLDKCTSNKFECVFPVNSINLIKRALSNGVAKHFKFFHLLNNSEIKALITPSTIDTYKYASILFYDIKESTSSSISNAQLNLLLKEVDNDISYYTREIITILNKSTCIDEKDKNLFLKKALQIRKSYLPVKSLYTENASYKHQTLNINTLSARIMNHIANRYKTDYFSYEVLQNASYPYIDFSFEALQIIMCNITVYLINSSLGNPHIKVFTNTSAKENQLIMSNDWSDTTALVNLFHKMLYHDPVDNPNLFFLKTLLSKYGATLTTQQLENESLAIIVHFRKADNVIGELRSSESFDFDNEIIPIMDIILSNTDFSSSEIV